MARAKVHGYYKNIYTGHRLRLVGFERDALGILYALCENTYGSRKHIGILSLTEDYRFVDEPAFSLD